MFMKFILFSMELGWGAWPLPGLFLGQMGCPDSLCTRFVPGLHGWLDWLAWLRLSGWLGWTGSDALRKTYQEYHQEKIKKYQQIQPNIAKFQQI